MRVASCFPQRTQWAEFVWMSCFKSGFSDALGGPQGYLGENLDDLRDATDTGPSLGVKMPKSDVAMQGTRLQSQSALQLRVRSSVQQQPKLFCLV